MGPGSVLGGQVKTTVHPVTGFQVASVHSMAEWSLKVASFARSPETLKPMAYTVALGMARLLGQLLKRRTCVRTLTPTLIT